VFPEPYQGRWSGWSLLTRFAIGAIVIFMLSAATVASAVLLEVREAATILKDESVPLAVQVRSQLKHVAPGKPQTILVIGDDRRKIDVQQGNPTRSDTMILVRLDPKRGATAMMSLPRDLLVNIPGHGVDKLNAAFAIGEDALTLRTIRSLLGIPIHHYVRVTFWGFREAVDRLGCVYVDVDRKYFNDNRPPFGGGGAYAAIDVPAGYQKLCGQRALDYVRYRHLDSDLVRAARQQSFLGQAKDQIGVSGVFADREKLLRIFARSVRTDGPWRQQQSVIVRSPDELAPAAATLASPYTLQHFHEGAPVVSVAGVIDEGTLLGTAVARYDRTWPPSAGSASACSQYSSVKSLSVNPTALPRALLEGRCACSTIARTK